MRRRGRYVDQTTMVRVIQASHAPILRAAHRAADAAVECNELLRQLPCRRPDGGGCRSDDAPVRIPSHIPPPPNHSAGAVPRSLLLSIVGVLLGVAVGGYLTKCGAESRNREQDNAVRDRVGSVWIAGSR